MFDPMMNAQQTQRRADLLREAEQHRLASEARRKQKPAADKPQAERTALMARVGAGMIAVGTALAGEQPAPHANEEAGTARPATI